MTENTYLVTFYDGYTMLVTAADEHRAMALASEQSPGIEIESCELWIGPSIESFAH